MQNIYKNVSDAEEKQKKFVNKLNKVRKGINPKKNLNVLSSLKLYN